MLSIIVPCYNEAANIKLLIEKFKLVADKYNNLEVLFVNNGSTDKSKDVFENELANCLNYPFRLVSIEKNIGYGFGLLRGLYLAKGDILSWTHADLQTEPTDIITALRIYQKSSDSDFKLIKGARRNRSLIDALFTLGMSLFTLIVLKVYISDINAQPKLFSRKFFKQIEKDAPNDFSLDLYFLYHAKVKGEVLDFPVTYHNRLFGVAKGGDGSLLLKFKLMIRTIRFILDFRNKSGFSK